MFKNKKIIFGFLLVILHLFFLGWVYFFDKQGFGYALIFLDFPIALLIDRFGGSGNTLILIGLGTLMYFGLGVLLGFIIEKLIALIKFLSKAFIK